MIKTEASISTSYKLYKSLSQSPETLSVYRDIANNYMKFLMGKVLQGEEVTLPAKKGTLSIRGRQRRFSYKEDGTPNLPPNWAKTKKLWDRDPAAKAAKKIIYCTNEETSGVIYKIHWSKMRVAIGNKSLYAFRLARTNKRDINAAIIRGVEYFFKPA